jgi:type I restriction enzyme R subunit
LAQDPAIKNPRIVLVTDRVDLDDQLCNTFRHCDKNPVQAKTGEHLLQLVKDGEEVITTVIDKFEAAMKKRDASDDSEDIFILVDEGHRSQYGLKNTRMQKVFPRACFIGFTGTPIMSGDKDTAMKFGGIVRPAYTMREAVMDGAVVPLLYEGRDVSKSVQEAPLDEGFGRVSEELSEYQKGQLKNQASRKEFLSANKQDVHLVAQDITDHFVEFWKDTGFKGQIVAFSKVVALELKASLDEIGKVTSEVVISPPDDREGHKDHFSGPTDEVQKFWASMMSRFGNEKSYNESVINAFKSSEDPELIIVVDKLLTGFDAPRNTVLYLYRSLKEHSLLQTITRVNRLHPGKDYGYVIDYWGVLGNLDKAMSEYDALKGFDEEDLHDTLTNLADEVRKLPQKHSDLWDVFKSIGNKSDKEAFELFLGDEEEREIFLKRLNQYGRCLANAKQSVAYLDELNDKKRNRFEKDLKFFQKLRKSVRARYSEDIDFKDYEARIQRLLDSYVTATGVEQITKQVNIFDKENFAKELDNLESVASRADTIAHRTAKSINERMEEDPAFFSPLSKMIKDAIKAFQQKRISDAEYLEKATEVMDKVTNRSGDNLPDALANNEEARPYYGIFKQVAGICLDENDNKEEISADLGLQIESIISNNKVRDWQKNKDCQNNMKNDIEDALLEASKREGFKISFEQIDEILERSIRAAIVRDGGSK